MNHDLPITISLESRIFLTYSSLAAHKEYEPLLNESLMNIAIYGDDLFTVVFTDNIDYNCALLSQCISDYKIFNQKNILTKETLNSILTENLCNGYYCQIWANEYYIKDSTFFQNINYIHPLLVYGFQKNEETGDTSFNAVMFNQEKGVILCQIALDDLFTAIKSSADLHLGCDPLQESVHHTIKAFAFKKAVSLPFNLNTFKSNFESYLFSRPVEINERFRHIDWTKVKYGLQVNDVIINVLENLDTLYMSFTNFCHFIVCKQIILQRLKYINELFPLSLQKEIDAYQELCNRFENLKLINIKLNFVNKQSINTLNSESSFIDKIIKTLKEQKEIERGILLSVYNKICLYLNNSNKSAIDKSCYKYSDNNVIVELDNGCYIYDIFIICQKTTAFKPVGVFKIEGFEYLTDKNRIKLWEISSKLSQKKVTGFEYTLLNADCCNINDLHFGITSNCLTISPETRNEFHVDWITDISENSYGMKIVNNDPFIAVRNLNLPEHLNTIYIQCKIKSTSNTAQLIFVTEDEDYLSISKSRFIAVQNDGSELVYKIDMSGNKYWHGIIKAIRFDPAHDDNTDFQGEFIMNYIKFTDSLPEYSSAQDFCNTQGVNNWFYYTTDSGIAYREMIWDDDEQAYVGINDKKLRIDRETQTASYYFSTVRKWICPAAGDYHVTCSFSEIGNGNELSVNIKRNHMLEASYAKIDSEQFTGSYNQILSLNCGETIGFEFYSGDKPQPAILKMSVVIKKIL